MDGKSVAGRIHDLNDQLTASGRKAARGLLGNYPLLGLAPVAEFAEAAGVSAASIVRFVAQLGFKSYPEFQRALRDELEQRSKSPLQRGAAPDGEPSDGAFLARYLHQAQIRLADTLRHIPESEFEAVAMRLASGKGACYMMGGRFTDFLAGYFEAHMRVIRPGLRRFDGRPATRADQLLDVRAGDMAMLFDVRRYDPVVADVAAVLARHRVDIVLITDEWLSPAARHARYVLPCHTQTGRAWDANGALFSVVEALIARVTEQSWSTASKRMRAVEDL